jgi:hypothetical protein
VRTKLVIAVSLIAILSVSVLAIYFIGFTGQAPAEVTPPAQTPRLPGVQWGDTFTYMSESHWFSDNATAFAPLWAVEYNVTADYKVYASLVEGVNATATYVWNFANQTEVAYLVTQDIRSGQSYYQSFNIPPLEIFTGANITQGELLHPTGNDTITVNQTISRNYPSGARETNIIEITRPIHDSSTDYTTTGMSTTTYYVDKAAGVIVEQESKVEHYANPNESMSIVWKLTATNLFSISD